MGTLKLWIRIGDAAAVPCRMIPLPGSQGRRWRVQLEGGRVVEPGEPCRILGGLDADRSLLARSGYATA